MNKFNMKAAKNALDKIWSKLVKVRDGQRCQKCGRQYGVELESAHIFPRAIMSVRWMMANGVTLCKWTCHRNWAEARKAEFKVWALNRLDPEMRDFLIMESQKTVMVNPSFIEVRKEILRREAKALEKTHVQSEP